MGVYVYRVTAKLIKLSDGRKAHVAKYAYKPYNGFGSAGTNSKLHFQSGCVASENLELKSDLITTVDVDDPTSVGSLYENKRGLKVFVDDHNFGAEWMPRVASVRKAFGSATYMVEKGNGLD